MFYGLLAEFAGSARKALRGGRAIPCCAGGDPVDGAAIRDEILQASRLFLADLQNADAEIRGYAASWQPFVEAGTPAALLVRERYLAENDAGARGFMLAGLVRVRSAFDDWTGFLSLALDRESDPYSRFSRRHARATTASSKPSICLAGTRVGRHAASPRTGGRATASCWYCPNAYCAAKAELWQFRTNLWRLFGLPETPEGLRRLVTDRS
jgi:hypothetical protein